MNKRIVSALVLAGMIASSSAFASNARNLVMGTGGADRFSDGGSFYYEDAYNFFYNPAYVNDYKNWAIFEKGTGNDAASFGFVNSMMDFNLGMFFNRNNALSTGTNAVDVMLGGDMGVKWGLGLTYGNRKLAADGSQNNLNVRAGVSVMGFDPYVNFLAIGSDKAAGTETTKYTKMGVGLRYHYGEWTPYAAYSNNKTKTVASGAETKDNRWIVGLGRETKIAEGARLAYAVYHSSGKVTSPGVETKFSKTPINMSIEADALSWLTLRAGANHELVGGTGDTTARIGGTFHIAKVDVDYAFGNTTAGATPDASDSANVGFDSATFHQIGMRYSW
jgi:hypothetical protein